MKYSKQPIILIIGTRPEAIKLAPIYYELKKRELPLLVCATSQHKALLKQSLALFGISPDIDFDIMKSNQDLFYITQEVMHKCKSFFASTMPKLVIVQGDTTSAMAACLASFYMQIPVGHVEAGLRTYTLNDPFPEESNRKLIGALATLHFAPTQRACTNLVKELGKTEHVYLTGNTVVDAMRIVQKKISSGEIAIDKALKNLVEETKKHQKKLIIITIHRRESLISGAIDTIFSAIKDSIKNLSDAQCIFFSHPNPAVQEALKKINISEVPHIVILQPLDYTQFQYLLLHTDLVITDSGGICEEACSAGKKVLIVRNETERREAIEQGSAELIGTEYNGIKKALSEELNRNIHIENNQSNIFGDGRAAQIIVDHIESYIEIQNHTQSHKKFHTIQKGVM